MYASVTILSKFYIKKFYPLKTLTDNVKNVDQYLESSFNFLEDYNLPVSNQLDMYIL